MTMEQVLSDRDSEDEVDDDVADLEDRRVSLIIARVISPSSPRCNHQIILHNKALAILMAMMKK